MVKKSPHELNLKELKNLAKKKNKQVCVSVNKMKKDDLIKYLYKNNTLEVIGDARKKKVDELRKLAKKKKERECKTYGKMDKNELIKYVYGYDVPEPSEKNVEEKRKEKVFGDICLELATIKNDENGIIKKRKKIYNQLKKKIKSDLTSGSFDVKLPNELFIEMFLLYDKYFFENRLTQISKKNNCQWYICWNERCIGEAAGMCSYIGGECLTLKIELNRTVFKKSSRLLKGSKLRNSGLMCDNLLSCIQITFEHEITHGILQCMCPKYQRGYVKDQIGIWNGKTGSIKSGHGRTFMSIVNNIFGHTDYQHMLTWDEKDVGNYDNAIKKGVKIKEIIEIGDKIKVEMMGSTGLKVDELVVTKKNPKTVIAEKDNYSWRIYYTNIIEIVGKNLVSKKKSDKKKKLTKKRK